MAQTRLILTASFDTCQRIFSLLDRAFEDDGLPVAMSEIDEAAGLHEISVYADDPGAAEARIRDVLGGDAFGMAIEREALGDVDWVAKSLEGLKPVRAGGFFVHGSHDRGKAGSGELAIEIEAGLAFGTGHHGTTAACLELIGDVLKRERPKRALDLGTGSGLLAIAIAKRSRTTSVLATDIDPVATRVARDNASLNGVAASVSCMTARGTKHRAIGAFAPFDLIVANILASPLMALATAIAHNTRRNSAIILSGILDSQRDRVVARYVAQGFRHRRTLHRQGWSTILLRR
jgi:ribosomal protein L11 methyltransferase